MRLFLLGLPGSGKSSLGKELAASLGYAFMDTDEMITGFEEMSIEEIFEAHGEDYFRKLESDMLLRVVKEDNVVISTGGGTPCYFDNMEIINKEGISIFLDVPPATIAKRLFKKEGSNRPMVKGKTEKELLELLENKYKERISFYEQAKVKIAGKNIRVADIIEKLEKQ